MTISAQEKIIVFCMQSNFLNDDERNVQVIFDIKSNDQKNRQKILLHNYPEIFSLMF